jgi:hypothetical protein
MTELYTLTGAFYHFGKNLFYTISISIWGLILVTQLGWMAYRWVSDAKTEWAAERRNRMLFFGKAIFLDEDEVGPFFFLMVVLLVGCLLTGLVWPLTLTVILIATVLYLLRGGLRFKRNVNKVLGNKADKDHTH